VCTTRTPGEKDLVRLRGLVAIAYQHETSRCGDPHLHVMQRGSSQHAGRLFRAIVANDEDLMTAHGHRCDRI
jgi:hypothetical protein